MGSPVAVTYEEGVALLGLEYLHTISRALLEGRLHTLQGLQR